MTDWPTIRAVAFDLMDTLVHDPWRAGLEAAFGERFDIALRDRDPTSWPRFERGELSEDGFWGTYADHDPDPEACRRARMAGTRWLPGMRELTASVQSAGVRTCLASNYPSWFEDVEAGLLAGVFEHTVVSYRIGVRKPDVGFYEAVAGTLEVAPEAIVFVDDRQENVEAARTLGMAGITFVDAATTRAALAELGVLV